nr:hypothetical protein [Parachlamydiaceae bacterium]
TPGYDAENWKEKLLQLFGHLPVKTPVESFGKAMNKGQILEIMHFIKNSNNDTSNRQKLSSIFAGITPFVFREVLFQASQEELSFLREEAVTETIQHHLSLIISELNTEFNNFCNRLTHKENEIQQMDMQTMGKENISELIHSIAAIHEEGKNILKHAGRALTIAWNANRTDLIQDLGRIKELCQKYLMETVGKDAQDEVLSSGLFLLLDKKVDALFSDQDASGNISIMKNSTPALEALVKFSVWYIQDYSEVGLLPNIPPQDEQDSKHEMDSLKQREQLFIAAEKNLNRIGLHTLSDLKRERIYSKKALMDYISTCQLAD